MINTKSKQLKNFWQTNQTTILIVAAALLLTIFLLAVRAGARFAAFEAESANLAGNAVIKSSAGLSGGKYVEFSAEDPTVPPPPAGTFECSRMLSMSQGRQTYEGLLATGRAPDGVWEAEITGGARLVEWVNRNFEGYDGNMIRTCDGAGVPDRIVFLFDPIDSDWPADMHAVIANIKFHHPQVERIDLILLVGADGDRLCQSNTEPGKTVRATTTHQAYDGRLQAVVESYNEDDDVVEGPDLEIPCSQYADSVGHMTDTGKLNVGHQMADWYGY